MEKVQDVCLGLLLFALLLVVADDAVDCLDWQARHQAEQGAALAMLVTEGGR